MLVWKTVQGCVYLWLSVLSAQTRVDRRQSRALRNIQNHDSYFEFHIIMGGLVVESEDYIKSMGRNIIFICSALLKQRIGKLGIEEAREATVMAKRIWGRIMNFSSGEKEDYSSCRCKQGKTVFMWPHSCHVGVGYQSDQQCESSDGDAARNGEARGLGGC